MRFWTSFLCILLLSGLLSAQQKKFLVSPNQEVIPLDKGTAEKIMNEYRANHRAPSTDPCLVKPTYGFTPDKNPIDQNFGFYHKDVCGEWFVVPANGNIDTIYFHTLAQVGPDPNRFVGAMDSTVLFRVFTSNITPTQGPGICPPCTFRPPCTSWGYYVNTNDGESGVAAFVEDATPNNQTSWTPTNTPPNGVDAVPSFPPFGNSIWGLQGFPVQNIKPNTDIKVVMSDLVPLTVHQGDVIFISFKIPGGNQNYIDDATGDIRFEIGASDQNAPYPSRDWKFYEHDSGPSNCAGVPIAAIKRGWVPRGPLGTDDTLATACYDIWFTMTPSSNIPPTIQTVQQLHNTTIQGPITFTCTVFDCDVDNPLRAGVANAVAKWTTDSNSTGSVWQSAPLTFDGNDQYEFSLPGLGLAYNQHYRWMYYKIVATDSLGLSDSSGIYSFKVVSLDDFGFYRADTTTGATPANISATGNIIDTTQWFIAPRSFTSGTVPHRGDDGSAGPFAINPPFIYYGDTMTYAWVGVNGAIALGKSATDTIDVNDNGFATTGFDFPYPQRKNREDTLHYNNMPKAFIAPYWADWVNKQDSPLAMFGHVRYKDDANKFVVEWDGLGDFDNTTSLAVGDIDTFRVVLNKTDNSLEFQYDNIGFGGLDTANLTGIQCDSSLNPAATVGAYPPFAYYNKNGYPTETHLHDGLTIHYIPVLMTTPTVDGWNLLSIASTYSINTKSFLYPTAISAAFIYQGGYVPVSTLTSGPGFWLKFTGAQSQEAIGRANTTLDIPLASAWNMIGSISVPVPVANITADAGVFSGSPTYFGYSGGYFPASQIEPGYGYWVRANAPGSIHLTGGAVPKTVSPIAELNTLHKITISQAKQSGGQSLYIGSGSVDASKYDMPPRAPEGLLDARFASNRMVEIYPSVLDQSQKYEYPIMISATNYPLTIRWEQPRNTNEQVTLTLKTEDGKVLASLNNSGKITLNDASVKKLVVTVNAGVAIPKVFALGRNYPNPFNPTTRFSVDVPRSTQVEVSVYDILGRKIATLFNGEQTAGYHTMEWDGRNGEGFAAPTGMYFIRMTAPAEQFSAVQKIMLMK